ncbi:hypothetical protein CPB83DRAFT_123170 [Crepidotus variabilis]|uniref:Uncharacterized protein n=1 Tax=Crepidotus variabilis TaxID=179855 RepID=A0A9P6ELI6_9AGAR|nr:hypothetical protein CPB83DRAFT_123170 [Crepidotus variabilis]
MVTTSQLKVSRFASAFPYTAPAAFIELVSLGTVILLISPDIRGPKHLTFHPSLCQILMNTRQELFDLFCNNSVQVPVGPLDIELGASGLSLRQYQWSPK